MYTVSTCYIYIYLLLYLCETYIWSHVFLHIGTYVHICNHIMHVHMRAHTHIYTVYLYKRYCIHNSINICPHDSFMNYECTYQLKSGLKQAAAKVTVTSMMAMLVAARGRARRSRIPRFESRPSAVLTSSPAETYQELVQARRVRWKALDCHAGRQDQQSRIE